MLHVYSWNLEGIAEIAHRIQHASIGDLPQDPEEVVFPNLIRIKLGTGYNSIDICLLTSIRFPQLSILEAGSIFIHKSTLCRNRPLGLFPHLQHLRFPVANNHNWVDLVHACKDSLISLKLFIMASSKGNPQETEAIHLARLAHLEVDYLDGLQILAPFKIVTPMLHTYHQTGESFDPECLDRLHMNKVVQVRYNTVPILSGFTGLEILQLFITPKACDDLLDQLRHKVACPQLKVIVICLMRDTSEQEMAHILLRWNEVDRPQVNLIFSRKRWSIGCSCGQNNVCHLPF